MNISNLNQNDFEFTVSKISNTTFQFILKCFTNIDNDTMSVIFENSEQLRDEHNYKVNQSIKPTNISQYFLRKE